MDQLAAPSNDPTSTDSDALGGGVVMEQESSNASQGGGKNPVDNVIEKALEAASKQWSEAPEALQFAWNDELQIPTRNTQVAQTGKVDRIMEIVEQCIVSDNLEICRTLFVDILKVTGISSEKFTQIYNPLIPRLRAFLQSRSLDLWTTPFVDLLQILIGAYLRGVLGKKGEDLNHRLRKIGCGCQDCQSLDVFILNKTTHTTLIRLVQKKRIHLEKRIAGAPDLCTYETIRRGSPHGVRVTKLPEVVEASTWDYRQKAARTFLSSIGTDEVIKKIMGGRYVDVATAINGTIPFGGTKTPRNGALASTSANGTPSAATTQKATADSSHASGSGTPASVPTASTAQVASRKRKHRPNVDLGFIDLT